jgi:hypothetical protein
MLLFLFDFLVSAKARTPSQLSGKKLCELTNELRRNNSLPELELSYTMEFIAQAHLDNLLINSFNVIRNVQCVMHSWFAQVISGSSINYCCYSVAAGAVNNCMTNKPQEITAKWPVPYTNTAAENAYGRQYSFVFGIYPEKAIEQWQLDPKHRGLLLNPNGKVCGAVFDVSLFGSGYQNIALLWIGSAVDRMPYSYDGDPLLYNPNLVLPTFSPSYSPSSFPTRAPSSVPTFSPSYIPSSVPTRAPSNIPTFSPSYIPSSFPTRAPSNIPTFSPSYIPSSVPTRAPSYSPTVFTTLAPSYSPTNSPTVQPSYTTVSPTVFITLAPSYSPTISPTVQPTQSQESGNIYIATFLFVSFVLLAISVSICVYRYFRIVYKPPAEAVEKDIEDPDADSKRYDEHYFRDFREESVDPDERFTVEYFRRIRIMERKTREDRAKRDAKKAEKRDTKREKLATEMKRLGGVV